jgi:hypothetical protein
VEGADMLLMLLVGWMPSSSLLSSIEKDEAARVLPPRIGLLLPSDDDEGAETTGCVWIVWLLWWWFWLLLRIAQAAMNIIRYDGSCSNRSFCASIYPRRVGELADSSKPVSSLVATRDGMKRSL